MNTLRIITNNQWRELISGYELAECERKEFDYLTNDELDQQLFVRYKGYVYCMDQFMRLPENEDGEMQGWHGVAGDSYFSGTLIRLSDCGDAAVMGHYYQ